VFKFNRLKLLVLTTLHDRSSLWRATYPAVAMANQLRNATIPQTIAAESGPNSLLKTFLDIPSKLFLRLRELDVALDEKMRKLAERWGARFTQLDSSKHHTTASPSGETDTMRNELGGERGPTAAVGLQAFSSFFLSRFALLILLNVSKCIVMAPMVYLSAQQALLQNRIRNIVVPTRQNPRLTALERRRLPFWRSLYAMLFPVDLSDTFSRAIVRIPSLLYISKAVGLWFIILMQSLDWYPTSQWFWLQRAGNYAASVQMEELAWSSFLAVCGVLWVDAVTRGLDGGRSPSVRPFDLVSVLPDFRGCLTILQFAFAMDMHFLSLHAKLQGPLDEQPWRPDPHTMFVFLVPLVQVSYTHLSSTQELTAI
jgi:hypothetical protein